MRAKSFFYVSLGILALALAYHLGAVSAGAQSSGTIQGANAGGGTGWVTGVVGRTFYFKRPSLDFPSTTVPDAVPGTSPVLATAGAGVDPEVLAILENGDVYRSPRPGEAWVYSGNLLGGPTPAMQPTFGQLKAHYRK